MLIMESSREALRLIAARSTAYDFFLGSQQRGFQCGVIYSPEQAYEDPHFKARGYQQTVHHPAVGRDVRHPGASACRSGLIGLFPARTAAPNRPAAPHRMCVICMVAPCAVNPLLTTTLGPASHVPLLSLGRPVL